MPHMRNKAPVIAFTYNEPTVFTEYLTDISAGREKARHPFRIDKLRIHERGASCGNVQDA